MEYHRLDCDNSSIASGKIKVPRCFGENSNRHDKEIVTMSARIDLTGKVFGKLEVLSFAGVENSHARWNCLCYNCYRVTDIPSNNLKIGKKNWCRKCMRSRYSYKDGLEMKKLLEQGETLSHIAELYQCSCSSVYKALEYAKYYNTYKKADIIISGTVFSQLEVFELVGSKNSHALYLCRCLRCKNTLEVTAINLKSGNSNAC